MFNIKVISRILFVLILVVSVLPIQQARAARPVALGPEDWAQLRALSPVLAAVGPDTLQAYLKASNTGESDSFGSSIAISGDTLVVGAANEDSNATGVNGNQSDDSNGNSGAAYVFVRTAGVWSQQAYLKASNTGGNFGVSVAIDSNTIVVGASGEKSNATGVNGNQADISASSAGAAYVFTRSAGVWSQQAYLKASNTDAGDNFGAAVAISGSTVVVGAHFEDSNATGANGNGSDDSFINAGAVYVFTKSLIGVWSQQAYLKASNTSADDNFGRSISIVGNMLVVGAANEDSSATGVNGNQADNSASNAGAVYVFTRTGLLWIQQAYLKASNTGANDKFGSALALSGSTLVVSAFFEDSNATGVNGNQADNSATTAGAVYVFTQSAGVWSQQAYLKASNTAGQDRFGQSVAISGNTLVVSANLEDSNATTVNGDQSNDLAINAGAAYLFTRSGTVWSQQSYLKAFNTETLDGYGTDVALSSDTLVVSTISEDSDATGVNGSGANNNVLDSGAAYVYVIPPHVVSSVRVNPSPSNLASVDFTVTFSEAVTGVDVGDFTLTATGVTGASVGGVSGSGATRTVTVNTGSGNGTIRLNVADNDTIIDAASNPLGGPGVSNGRFLTGEVYTIDKTISLTATSNGTVDGWVLESAENGNVGATLETAAATFQIGDDAGNKQFRAVLHFNTSAVPDTAVITKATLKITKQGLVGTDPFTTHGALRADISNPFLGTAAALQASDFEAVPGSAAVASFGATPVGLVYSAILSAAGHSNISLTGTTQFRLRFVTDDNNDLGADFMKFFSGDFATIANRPTLVIEYFVP